MSLGTAYARALFETAQARGQADAQLDQLTEELERFARTLGSSHELGAVLTGPVTTAKEKADVVRALGTRERLSPLIVSFLELVARKNRMEALPEILEALESVRLEADGGVLGRIVSADPMEASDLDAVAKAFRAKLGKKISLKVSTDPSLLAGLKVTVNGVTYDGTLRSQLDRLKDRLVAAPVKAN